MASSDLVNMGIGVVSYTLKDVHDDQVRLGSHSEGSEEQFILNRSALLLSGSHSISVSDIYKCFITSGNGRVGVCLSEDRLLEAFLPGVWSTTDSVLCLPSQDYLHSLGKARTAQVQKDARIGEAQYKRDAVIRVRCLSPFHIWFTCFCSSTLHFLCVWNDNLGYLQLI